MATDKARLHYLLQRYTDNSCTQQEMEELFGYIREASDDEELNDFLFGVWNNIHTEEAVPALNKEDLDRQVLKKTVRLRSINGFGWLKVAAMILLFVSVSVVLYFITRSDEGNSVTADTMEPTDTSAFDHKLIILPDGSTVLLNDNSEIDYPQFFPGKTREITLHGEAYFDIKRDTSKPFIIHSGKLKTMVLGTAFNIRAYADEIAVVVTVTRGKVMVELENKSLGIITPNQQISFNTITQEATKNKVVADSVILWKQNDLVFDDITFAEAAEVISKRFKVDISFANNGLKNCRFHASFLNDNSLEQVLKVICDLNGANYLVNENKITINGEGCE